MKNISLKLLGILIFLLILSTNISFANNNHTWEDTLSQMNIARRNASSLTYNNKIYVFGGISGKTILDSVEVYDIENDTWTTSPTMPIPRHSHKSILYQDKVYIIGGYNNTDGILDRLDIFDLKTNQWTTGASMSEPKSGFSAEIIDEKIYCIGGEVPGGYSNIMNIYDIKSNTWEEERAMYIARGDITSVQKNKKIYK